MKNILVPMDLSEVSINALKYASKMYTTEDIHILHVQLDVLDPLMPFETPEDWSAEAYYKKVVEDHIKSSLGSDFLDERMNIHIRFGTIVETIKQYALSNHTEVVVMGTKDNYDILENWLGTVSLGVVKTLGLPTYLIPRFSKFKSFKSVVIGSDDHLRDVSAIRKIINWNEVHKAELKFVHIKENETDDFVEAKDALVQQIFLDQEPDFSFEVIALPKKNISDSLLAYSHNNNTDLIVLMPDKQSFVGSLFLKSNSKEMIQKSDIPILFIHNN